MATDECKPQGICQPIFEEAAPSEEAFSFSSSARRKSVDRSCDLPRHIDMDIAVPCQWDRMKTGRRLQKSLDSQEFEFNMSVFAPDLLEPAQVAPADELFYKGQLLPLQPDPRLQLVQTLSSTRVHQRENDEPSQNVVSCSLREEDVKFSSCRLDAVGFDTSFMDFRCSSFRSQNSSYWESGDKDTGDSSSSRDSNGSSQDSCFSGDKEVPGNCASGRGQAGKSVNQSRRRSAFNWKSFFGGIKKASKIWVDERAESSNYDSTHPNLSKQKRSLSSPNLRNSVQPLGNISANGASPGLNRSNSKSQHLIASVNPIEKLKEPPASACNSSTASFSVKRSASPVEREKHRTAWRSRERWQRYVKKLKPLYVKISQKYDGRGFFGQLRMDDCGKACAVDSTTRLVRPPLERRLSQSSVYGNSDYFACSSRNLTIASCPASMRSSPNHSGVLAVINKGTSTATSMSTMQELQSAVQGAIAHCKQSNVGKPTFAVGENQ